jgi:oligopeptide transport system substrate-binding protein
MLAISRRCIAAAALLLALPPAVAFAADNILIRGFGDNWESLDPQVSFSGKDAYLMGDIYEGLVGVDAAGKAKPGAAQSWDISADGLTYTFHLRPALKWSNGERLTAQDFVNGMKRMLDPKTASQKAYFLVSNVPVTGAADFNAGKNKDFDTVGIKAPDDHTVVIHLDQPQPHALDLLIFYETAPAQAKVAHGETVNFADPSQAVGNGAYILKEVVPQSHIELVKNPNYWDAANVKQNEVRYLVTADAQTELKLFLTGGVDITSDVPVDKLAEMKKEHPQELHISPLARPFFLSLNFNKSPLSDIRVRKALALAIDRNVLAKDVMQGGETAVTSYVPTVDPTYPQLAPEGFSKPAEYDAVAKNLALAKKLMAEAGYGPDHPLTISFECFSDNAWKRRAETVAVMWQQWLGVVSKMRLQESQAHWNSFSEYKWDVYCDSFSGDYAGAEPFLAYRTKAANAGYKWDNAKYEELMAQVEKEADLNKRNVLLAQAEQVLLNDYVLAPLSSADSHHMVAKRLHGWVDNPVEYHLSKYMSLSN